MEEKTARLFLPETSEVGTYEDFVTVTRESLRYALMENGAEWTTEAENELIDAYTHLTHYSEVEGVLQELKDKELVILSNGTQHMLDSLIENASLAHHFDSVLSVDDVKQFKPAPAAYTHALKELDVKREEVLFMSSNGWDISGAKNFGFHTAWINRGHAPTEQLGLEPDAEYDDLTGILEWK
ncbi:haloacid dehalogenase type II [Rossellomorea marisflavi]|uniref:haloacid dehalogenase type II n=1 Tax=Rossellomorea marisflavi TaxID=189381 RepID=UPI003D28C8BE